MRGKSKFNTDVLLAAVSLVAAAEPRTSPQPLTRVRIQRQTIKAKSAGEVQPG